MDTAPSSLPRENVFIFGAGCSFDADIPLLGNFIDRMRTYLYTRKGTKDQSIVLEEANQITIDLEGYNSRALFDTRNIEDVLSILAFKVVAEEPLAKQNFRTFVEAIGITMELASKVKLKKEPPPLKPREYDVYHEFIHALWLLPEISRPAIVSFNYDLVIERALWN